MLDATSRRTFTRRLATFPLLSLVGASFFARRADAAALAVMAQINQAERRCHDTKQAFDNAVAAFEASLPELPPSLDMTDRRPWPFRADIERRRFDRELRRRAARYEIAISVSESAFDLQEKAWAHEDAKKALTELGHAIFAKPAETNHSVQAQARMLSAYLVSINEQYATFQAGRWGDTLATSVLLMRKRG